jgi:hypothetical protein
MPSTTVITMYKFESVTTSVAGHVVQPEAVEHRTPLRSPMPILAMRYLAKGTQPTAEDESNRGGGGAAGTD